MEWEYRFVTKGCERHRELSIHATEKSHENELNRLGAEGWELVSVVPLFGESETMAVTYILKRQLSNV